MKPLLFCSIFSLLLLFGNCTQKRQELKETDADALFVSNRSAINIIPDVEKDKYVVGSHLNHYTSIKVGIHKKQYAVVIETHPNKMPKQSIANSSQEFGDEILDSNIVEDEIVEETIALPETQPIASADLPSTLSPKDTLTPKGSDNKVTAKTTFNIKKVDGSYLLGKFNPATHPDFTKISKSYSSRKGMYIRKDTYTAFIKMYKAAKKDGITLTILSATRSFSSQKRIWEAKWTGHRKVGGKDLSKALPFGRDRAQKILEYSAMPGTSRHHWGTDIDLCALNNKYFESGTGKKIYNWLVNNAEKYGFHQPYTEISTRNNTGHSEEKWHWSYTPVSKLLTQKYAQILNNQKITGFKGEDTAPMIQIMEKYVLAVSSDCK